MVLFRLRHLTVFNVCTCEWDPSASAEFWTPGSSLFPYSPFVTYSQRFESYIGTNSNGIFSAVPNIDGPDLFQLYFGATNSITYLNVCQTRDLLKYGSAIDGSISDSYYTVALGTGSDTNWGFMTYDYGVNSLTPQYPPDDMRYEWAKLFTNLDYNHETDEQPREQNFQPDEYNFTDFSYPYTSASPLVTAAPIENNTLEYNPNTAVFRNWTGTVYENIDALYNSNIVLGVLNQWNLGSASFQVTNATTGDTVYYQPTVAIGQGLGCSTDYFAIITYIRMIQNLTGPPSFSQEYCFNTVDLTTSTVGTETVLETAPSGEYWPYFRNWDVVHDTNTPGFIFLYSDDDTGSYRMCMGEVLAAIFNGCGAYSTTTTLQIGTGNTFDQVRACYDPDPTNYGAYVTWRDTPNPLYPTSDYTPGDSASIAVQAIGSASGALWSQPTYFSGWYYGNPNNSYNPCICAGPATASPLWAFVGWEDSSSLDSLPNRIYGGVVNNSGTALTYAHTGTQLSPGSFCTGCSPDEAHHPDAIANPLHPDSIMVAYDFDEMSRTVHTNGVQQIEIDNFNLSLSLWSAVDLVPTPDISPAPALPTSGACDWEMDDAKWSLYGYMQRRPKLIAIKSDLSAFPHDSIDTPHSPTSWVMCVYEAEAYNLYQSTPTASGGTGPNYGLGGSYLGMWKQEMVRGSGVNGGYWQNNVLATVVNPDLSEAVIEPWAPLIAGRLAVFANTNAQDLKCVAYTDQLGPMATCIDYANTDNGNGIVRMNQIIPNYYSGPGTIIPGGTPLPNWAAPPPLSSTDISVPAVFANSSYMPLRLYPAVGSQTPGVVAGTWVDNDWLTINPEGVGNTTIDYFGNGGDTNILTLTGCPVGMYGQWPLTLPDWYGSIGNKGLPQGCGFKIATGPQATIGNLSLAVTENPANTNASAIISGSAGRTAKVRVVNMLGETVQDGGSVTISSDGTSVPLNVTKWPSGNYIIEATGDEGSNVRAMLSIQH